MARRMIGETNFKGMFYRFSGTNTVTITSEYTSWNRYEEPKVLEHVTQGDTDAKLAAMGFGVTRQQFNNQLVREYNEMIRGVQANGGFYVGRYETKVAADGEIMHITADGYEMTKTWYKMYSIQKVYYSSNNNIQTSMIWGSQYDQMLLWMKDAANPVTGNLHILDSTGRGSIKNVYDLYNEVDNMHEWILEVDYDSRGSRTGGNLR